MANQPRNASDYLAQAQAGLAPAQKSSKASQFDVGTGGVGPQSTQAKTGTRGVLGTLMDLITRPLSGVTNALSDNIDRTAAVQQAEHGNGDLLGAAANQFIGDQPLGVIGSFLSGLTSNNPELHRSTSDVIEQATDKLGAVDPNYKNVANNANPILKGVFGFAGDIALDPLTWIPGAQIAKVGGLALKGAKLGVTGAKGALDAVSGATKAAKVVDDAASVAAESATKIARPTAQQAAAHGVERIDQAAADNLGQLNPEFKAIYDSHLSNLERQKSLDEVMNLSDARMQRVVAGDVARATKSVKGQSLREGLASLGPVEVKNITRIPGVTAKTAKPAPFRNATAAVGSSESVKGFVEHLADASPEEIAHLPQGIQKAAKAAVAAKNPTVQKQANKALETFYTNTYLPQFAQAKAAGKILSPTLREVAPVAGQQKTTVTALDSLANFKSQLAQDRGAVESRLGKPLTAALGRYDNAGNFDSAVSRLKGVLDQQIDVTTLRHLSASDDAALRHIGLDPATIPTGLKMQTAKNSEPVANTLTEQLAKMVDPAEQPAEFGYAQHALDNTIMRDLVDVKDTHPSKTKTGTLRTEDQFGAGWGRNMREANTYFQYNLAKNLSESIGRSLVGSYGASRAAQMSETFRKSLRLAESVLDKKGVPLTIGVGPKRIPLATSQILDAFDRLDRPTTLVSFFNHDTAVPWTNLSDAVYSALTGGSRDDIEKMLRQVETRHVAADGRPKPLPNNMIQGQGRFGRARLNSDAMVGKLTDLIDKSRPFLNRIVAENAQALGARGIDETYEITNEVLNGLEQLKATPGATGQLLQAVGSMDSRVKSVAADLGMMKASEDTAQAIVESTVPTVDQIIAKGTVRASDMLRNSEAAEEAQTGAVKIAQSTFEDVVKSDPAITTAPVEDFGQKIDQVAGRGIMGKVVPIFSRRAGTEKVYPDWMRAENIQRTLTGHYHLRLSAIAKAGLPREQLANRLVNARNGVATDDPTTNELRDLWGQMFGQGDRAGALIDNGFFRNANNVHHVNQMLEAKGLNPEKYSFDINLAEQESKQQGISFAQALSNQSSKWEITDPLDTMSKLYTSFVQLQVHQTLIQDFLKMAKDLGAVSKVPQAGYKLAGNETGRSVLAMYFPKDLYVEQNVLRQAHVVDNLMQQTMDLSGPLGKFVREVYVPLQQAWKYGMTLPNPTHQIRNYISDLDLQRLALGTKGLRKSVVSAAQAIAGHNNYDGWDGVRFLQGLETLPDAGHVVMENARGWKLTADGLYQGLANRGNLMTFQHLEQLNADAGEQGVGALAKVWDTFQQGKIVQKIGGVSEARDHLSRLQHAAQFVSLNADNPKFKTLDDLLTAASQETRKWHPDGTDMTQAEKYFRLVVPFYSWQRKAIPLVIEALLTHPGRVSAIPKAQYNIAVAAGINPDSLSDPFPQDQLFPSYMTNNISGPVAQIDGHYYGINPGFAANDVLNMWAGSNPLRSALGSVSPLIRAPFELAAGGNVGTGATIHDPSDYIDSQIPGLAQASRFTGVSPTGSVVSLLQGDGLDQQYQVKKGNRSPTDIGLSALNWLTGAGITDMSAPNAINYAEIEKRNAAGKVSSGF